MADFKTNMEMLLAFKSKPEYSSMDENRPVY